MFSYFIEHINDDRGTVNILYESSYSLHGSASIDQDIFSCEEISFTNRVPYLLGRTGIGIFKYN